MSNNNKHQTISIFTDGASRGNPGNASIGIAAYLNLDGESRLLLEYAECIGIATNNEAEWKALLKALEFCQEFAWQNCNFYLDSELVVRQLNGIYKVKKPHLQEFYQQAQKLSQNLEAEFIHIKREKNKKADKLANQSLDKEKTIFCKY